MELFLVPVEKVLELGNPLEMDIWECGIISETEIQEHYRHSHSLHEYAGTPYSSISNNDEQNMPKEYHIDRIVHLMRTMPNSDMLADDMPISIDLWEGETWYPIIDGNHRLIACHLLGISHVWVSISGDLDYAEESLVPIDSHICLISA